MTVQDLYIASFDQTDGPAWVARHGLDAQGFQQEFDALVGQGFRLTCVSGYTAGGDARYAGIWEQRGGPAWAAHHGMTSEAYQQAFDTYAAQGFRPVLVNGYEVGGRDHYVAIWEQVEGPAWAARHGLDGAGYQQEFDALVGQGFRLRWVSTYAVGGVARYAAIFEQSQGPAWVARHGMDEDGFAALAVELGAQGYELVCGSACVIDGRDRYAALWELRDVQSFADHGMTNGTYQQRFEQVVAQGFRPRFVAGYAANEPVDVVLRFAMEQQTQTNWCWAATGASIGRFYDAASPWTQCLIANAQLSRNDCCGTGASGACNVYGSLDDAIQRVGRFAGVQGGTISYADVRTQLLAGRPVGIRVAWSGGGAHFVAATGVENDGWVMVSDCGSGTSSLVAYDTLVTAYAGSGAWTHTYLTQQ